MAPHKQLGDGVGRHETRMKEMEGGLSGESCPEALVMWRITPSALSICARELVVAIEVHPEHRIEARSGSQERRGQRLEVGEV